MFATYDIVMLIVFAGSVLFGVWKGLAWQIASLSAIFVSYLAATQFSGPVSGMIRTQAPLNKFIAMAIIYTVTSLGIWILFGAVRKNIEKFQLREFDRQIGGLVGAIQGSLLCIVVTMFAVTLPGDGGRRAVIESRTGGWIAGSLNKLETFVPEELHAVLDPYFKKVEERLNAPLPPLDQNSSGWSLNGIANTPENRPSIRPQSFNLPVSFSQNPEGGISVDVNTDQLLNSGRQWIGNEVNKALGLPAGQQTGSGAAHGNLPPGNNQSTGGWPFGGNAGQQQSSPSNFGNPPPVNNQGADPGTGQQGVGGWPFR